MSQTGPLGHSPVNLSTSMGLSDPRLRRALQLSQVMEQKLGFGLKLDSEGRLAVDSKSVAADSTTVNTLLKTLISSTSTVNNSFVTNEFDESLLDEMVLATSTGQLAADLDDVVGPGDWPDNSASIASYVLGIPQVKWTTPVETTDARFTNTTITPVITQAFGSTQGYAPLGTATEVWVHASVQIVRDNLSGGQAESIGVKLSCYCMDSSGNVIEDSGRALMSKGAQLPLYNPFFFGFTANSGSYGQGITYIAIPLELTASGGQIDSDAVTTHQWEPQGETGSNFSIQPVHTRETKAYYGSVPPETASIQVRWTYSGGSPNMESSDWLEANLTSQLSYYDMLTYRPGN